MLAAGNVGRSPTYPKRMGAASAILGILSFILLVGGLVTSFVPYVGSVLSFGAPIVALFGIVLGGVGLSRAKSHGDGSTLATLGLTLNVIGFIFGLLVAVTCGVCNACMSQAQQQNAQWNLGPTPGSSTWPNPTNPTPFQPPPLGPNGVAPDPGSNGPNGVAPDPFVPGSIAPDPSGAVPDPSLTHVPECITAGACCRAFFDDEAVCRDTLSVASAAEDPREACTQIAREYRAGLTSLDREIPADCRR